MGFAQHHAAYYIFGKKHDVESYDEDGDLEKCSKRQVLPTFLSLDVAPISASTLPKGFPNMENFM